MSLVAYDCNKCGETKFPGFVMSNAGKLVLECSVCQYIDTSLGPADFNQGIAAIAEGSTGEGWAGKRQVLVDTTSTAHTAPPGRPAAAQQAAAPAPAAAPRYTAPPAIQPGNIIGMMEDRALWLGAEEARLEGERAGIDCELARVRGEARKLTKMLRAGRKLVGDGDASTQPQLALVRS